MAIAAATNALENNFYQTAIAFAVQNAPQIWAGLGMGAATAAAVKTKIEIDKVLNKDANRKDNQQEEIFQGATIGTSGDMPPNEEDPWKDMEGSKRKAPEKIKNGPDFPNIKEHAIKHSTVHPNAYYNNAVKHIQTGQKFLVRHDGQNKYIYITRSGVNKQGPLFNITSTSQSGNTIFTHVENVTEQYLKNKGITLPKVF